MVANPTFHYLIELFVHLYYTAHFYIDAVTLVSPCAKQTRVTTFHLFGECENVNGTLDNAQT